MAPAVYGVGLQSLTSVMGAGFFGAADALAGRRTTTTRTTHTRTTRTSVNHHHTRSVHHSAHYHRGPAHPVAATAIAAIAIGAMVATLSGGCSSIRVGGISYQQCGNNYYQPQYVGTTVNYIVVTNPF